jgi:DNA mismatch repair ATPase MutS
MLDVVKALPDLERGLVQCHYKRCSPQAFLSLLQSFKKCISPFIAHTAHTAHTARPHTLELFIFSACHLRVSKCAPPREALEQQVNSALLRSLLHYPDMCDDVDYFLNAMSTKAAQTGKKRKLFVDSDQFPEVAKYHSVRLTIFLFK